MDHWRSSGQSIGEKILSPLESLAGDLDAGLVTGDSDFTWKESRDETCDGTLLTAKPEVVEVKGVSDRSGILGADIWSLIDQVGGNTIDADIWSAVWNDTSEDCARKANGLKINTLVFKAIVIVKLVRDYLFLIILTYIYK